MPSRRVIGVDPGTAKAGYAVLDDAGRVLTQGIEPVEALAERLAQLCAVYDVSQLVVGHGTNSAAVARRLESIGVALRLVDERETTRFARALYFEEHPPRGWRRLLPLGLQTPPCPVDDYAAILIARRYLAAEGRAPATS